MAKKIENQTNEQPIPEIYTNLVQTVISPYEFLLHNGTGNTGRSQTNM